MDTGRVAICLRTSTALSKESSALFFPCMRQIELADLFRDIYNLTTGVTGEVDWVFWDYIGSCVGFSFSALGSSLPRFAS